MFLFQIIVIKSFHGIWIGLVKHTKINLKIKEYNIKNWELSQLPVPADSIKI